MNEKLTNIFLLDWSAILVVEEAEEDKSPCHRRGLKSRISGFVE